MTADPDVISPSEISILDALLNGGRALSLKVTAVFLIPRDLVTNDLFSVSFCSLFNINALKFSGIRWLH